VPYEAPGFSVPVVIVANIGRFVAPGAIVPSPYHTHEYFSSMPPKKEQLSSEKLRELMLEKGIRFKGFEPPRAWPERYVPIFRKIRMIEDMRYDSYKSDTKIPSERREYCIQEVRLIRARVEKLLDNTANESTWRELEHRILKRFDERVIW
jgi:hypothetical protein